MGKKSRKISNESQPLLYSEVVLDFTSKFTEDPENMMLLFDWLKETDIYPYSEYSVMLFKYGSWRAVYKNVPLHIANLTINELEKLEIDHYYSLTLPFDQSKCYD